MMLFFGMGGGGRDYQMCSGSCSCLQYTSSLLLFSLYMIIMGILALLVVSLPTLCPQNFQQPSYDPWPISQSMRNRSCTLSVRSAALTNLPSGSRMTNLSLPQLALDSHLMAASTALTLTLLSWMMRLSTRSLSMVLKALLRSWWKVNAKGFHWHLEKKELLQNQTDLDNPVRQNLHIMITQHSLDILDTQVSAY